MIHTINKVTDYLKSNPCVDAAYIVGSFANGVKIHDVDMLLIGNEFDKQVLQYHLVNDLGATEVFVNDDSIACHIDGVDFDFALLAVQSLLRRAENIAQMTLFAEHRNWCVGYWMPEGFLYDLRKAQVVIEKSSTVRECIDGLLAGYGKTRRMLIEEIKKEIRLKSLLKKELAHYNTIARSDVLAAFMRIANLVEGWELTSFKHIDRKIRGTGYARELEMLAEVPDEQFAPACEAMLRRYFE